MKTSDIAYWEKARAICCREWGIPPWQFDSAWENGQLTTVNVQRAIDAAYLFSPHPEALDEWINPGAAETRKQAAEEEKLNQSWLGLLAMREREQSGG